ncbi:undecaprenyl pyrophosphate synthetase [Alkalihalophilus pseudofirmus OF4]|uniref:Isoprenyl transferase n=1 Tax=Alkalihalophilus pseudofirmus (strain ATCC BAA-2126 / JCM 17055 / OF4) TaxID=398511 RepID=D3FSD3_ALKPO|nr:MULTISPECIES: isoprenyl transferase [Alkalihalophilus]ADC48074.1 undecaprenyl pyrophosphate synthetase [Alkalihalophilus pseudofirmus OF4]MED1602319.1 isoprenyl transferase [Alkalihalophilus marmarensis]
MLEKFSKWKSSLTPTKTDGKLELDPAAVPRHVAIIMDGNGRWAKQKGLPRIAGHREGMKVVNKIVRRANELGVEVLTLYAFSTENWKRPKTEVDYLMKLPERFLGMELPKLMEENVKVRLMGSLDHLPEHTLRAVNKAVHETKDNTGLILNFALNYGSRFEMVEAMKEIALKVEKGELKPSDIDDKVIESNLMTADLKDPDLLIRTSGEIRLSNFMLWQVAYSEFWFTDVLWPDFNEEHFTEAISIYQKRARRFGGV